MNAPPERLTDFDLPRARYRPGLMDRPRGEWGPHVESGALGARGWRDCAAYCYGVDLYNLWYWWEAHEALESVWMRAERGGVERAFLQGVIMVAAAALMVEASRFAGAARLIGKAEARFERVETERFGGGDLRAWRAAIRSYYGPALGGGTMAHDAARFPYLWPGDD